jgi:hypothetical protein
MSDRPLKFIVAASRRHADNTAAIDWKWERGPNGTWIDNHGDRVRYVSELHQLYGYARGAAIVFLGFDWFENDRLRGLRQLCQERDYRCLHGPIEAPRPF